MFYVILSFIFFFSFNQCAFAINSENRYTLYKMIDENNIKKLKPFLETMPETFDINYIDKIYDYNLFSYSLLKSKYKSTKLLKDFGGQVSKNTFLLYLGNYFIYLNKTNINEILYFAYPETYNYDSRTQNYIDGMPFIYTQIILYLLDNPIDTMESLFDSSWYIYKLMGKEDFYFAMENYILGLLNTNYKWPVDTNNDSFSINFSFIDKAIDKKGYTRVNKSAYIYNEENMNIDEKKENYLWTLSKFFHRRGETFGNLCSLYIIKILEDKREYDKEAEELYNKYGMELKIRYNQFAKKWNKGELPTYPYEKFEGSYNKFGQKISLPIHLNSQFLKEEIKEMPILEIPIFDSSKNIERIWNIDYHNVHYFKSDMELMIEAISKLRPDSSNEEITRIYSLVDQSSYKYSAEAWTKLYFKLKELKIETNINNVILEKIILLFQGPHNDNLENVYEFIDSVAQKGYKYDAIKIYNSIKIKNIQFYRNSYESTLQNKVGGAIGINAYNYFKNKEYNSLNKEDTLKKFLLENDYNLIKKKNGFEEIFILLDREEVEKLYKLTKNMVEDESTTTEDLIKLLPSHYFFCQWPVEEEAKLLYEKVFLEYLNFISREKNKTDLINKLSKVVFIHNFENKEIYKVFLNNFSKKKVEESLLKFIQNKINS